ncbi:MAG TPA: hypothetical protein VL989_02960 [Candidatus Sulfotelmatobacter sp.]|nr:hypothetical protein [Candidatus Sulfotelmatobacter sp.]
MSPVICPTITAENEEDYGKQIDNILGFAERIHIDLMDGKFAPTTSLDINKIWWPEYITADLHLMNQKPEEHIDELRQLKPHLVIVHIEAELDHKKFCESLKGEGIKTGIALLKDSELGKIKEVAANYDHILVFGGHLGYHGGQADMSLIDKLENAKELYPDKEISWDGGINDQNAKSLVEAGASVLDVGGFIQDDPNPEQAYAKLKLALH